ncbi:hypothetical protein, partial [Bacillus anthracis]|uniref:hypothetical protein n=1 Tax=Bacillus anthracis TaxID=1392 RepID=UPI001E6561E6
PGPTVDAEQMAFLRAYFVMGDDFIGLCEHPLLFNRLLDFLFGTRTKTQEKKFFSVAGLREPEGAEFLKKHFALDKTHDTWNVRSFRAPERLLAKLYHGGASQIPGKRSDALFSAIWENGYTEPVYEILESMLRYMLDCRTVQKVEKYLELYVKRTPALHDCLVSYVPSFADVVNSDSSLIRPALQIIWSSRAKEVGCRGSWYN